MKRYLLLLPFFSILLVTNALAQGTLAVTITGGTANSTCGDIFGGAPDPIFQVKINDGEWETYNYLQNEDCLIDYPHVQFEEQYDCPVDIGVTTMEVCLKVIENDALNIANCNINPDDACTVEVCRDFDLPFPGASSTYNLAIPDGEASSGNVDFTISIDDQFIGGINDIPCTATDMGTLERGTTIGDSNTEAFTNYCGTGEFEPNDIRLDDIWFNNAFGVWHKFKTGDNPSSKVVIEAISSTIDPVHLQVALFEAAADCLLEPTVIGIASDRTNYNERLEMECLDLQPNTDYLILIDGFNDVQEEFFGYYSLEVKDAGSREAANLRCSPEELGIVPENGSITPTEPFSNFCADAATDPEPIDFDVEQGVVFTFTAPSSGNVLVNATSDPNGIDPIALEMALFESSDNTCRGEFTQLAAVTAGSPAQNMEVRCLEGGRSYYLLIDGSRDNVDGIFNLSISDLGVESNITTIDTTLCAGQRIAIGMGIYNTTGQYEEVITLPSGCDSTVFLNLTVQTPLEVEGELTENATDENATDGIASVSANGGSGVYSYEWSDGQTTATAIDLVAATEYCVTVTDETGCQAETCVFIEFINSIQPDVSADPLDCNGDSSGQIAISATKGEPPYNYTWQGINNELSGNGILTAEDELELLESLPAGDYQIIFSDTDDNNTDTTVIVTITEPTPLTLTMTDNVSATCFAECNGSLTVLAAGGNDNYRYEWSNGAQTPTVNELCAGQYRVIVFDNNECETMLALNINQPSEFIATATETQSVSCFGESDGRISVTANKGIQAIQWSTGDASDEVIGLTAGTYEVTVTDMNDCSAVSTVELTEPDAPLAVSIDINNQISCHGEADGSLSVNATGPTEQLTYNWSNGASTATANNLTAGNYSVTITNANGCTAMAALMLEEPNALTASVAANIITCLDEPNAGEIYIETTNGGVPPYEYAIDGVLFSSNTTISNLFDGGYEVTIRDAAGCEINRSIIIEGPPDITVDLGEDFVTKLGEPVVLNAITNSSNPNVTWSLDSTSCITADCSKIELMPLETATYSVTIFDELTQCSATDQVQVRIDKQRNVYVPNAFSPNADGHNDRFTVFSGGDVEVVNTFRVFDRYGALVYEMKDMKTNDTEMGWDGTFNGENLNSGVYVWIAEVTFIDGWKEMYRGDVTIF